MDPSTGASIPARRRRREPIPAPASTPERTASRAAVTRTAPVARNLSPTGNATAPRGLTTPRRADAGPALLPSRPAVVNLDALPIPAPPTFADRTFDVVAFGAVADDATDNSDAFARAIAACVAAGGGRVLVPAGRWLSGPIRLFDGVELHLAAGARLRFVDDPSRYLPAVELYRLGHAYHGHAPAIYAHGAARVGLTGEGTLVGNGASWWAWARTEARLVVSLVRQAREAVPVAERRFADPAEPGLRPPFVSFVGCRDVLIDHVGVDGAGSGCAFRLIRCDRVTLRGVRVRVADGPQDHDGLAFEACRDVRVTRCDVEAVGNALRIAGDAEGRPSERVTVVDVRLRSERCDGIAVAQADVRDVRVGGAHVASARHGVSLRGTRGRGGTIERVSVENLTIDEARGAAIFVGSESPAANANGGVSPAAEDRWPTFRGLGFRHVTCARAAQAVWIAGLPDQCVEDLTIHDVDLRAEAGLSVASAMRVSLRDVRVTPLSGPDLALRDVRDVWIDGIRHDRPSATFLDLRGRRTARVHLASARDARVRPAIVLGVDVPRDALVQE